MHEINEELYPFQLIRHAQHDDDGEDSPPLKIIVITSANIFPYASEQAAGWLVCKIVKAISETIKLNDITRVIQRKLLIGCL